jgi:hypothetical protein
MNNREITMPCSSASDRERLHGRRRIHFMAMGERAKRIQSVALLALALAREPRHIPEVREWWKHHSSPPIGQPWWPANAIRAVGERLPPGAQVFEYGSGSSTLWLAAQGAIVTSVEHHKGWHDTVAASMPPTVTLLLRQPGLAGSISSGTETGAFDEYVGVITTFPDDSFELVVVDGRARVDCGLRAMVKVAPGGMLLLDDSNRRRYRPLRDALSAWVRADFRGLKPQNVGVAQTTIWTRPV